MKTLFVFRHGETDWNREGRMQGGTDIHLNQLGRDQAAALRGFLQKNPVDVILSSDLTRALETARIGGADLRAPIVLDPRLRETNLGEAEGLTMAEVRARFSDEFLTNWRSVEPRLDHFKFPGGESKREHLQRVVAALEDFVHRTPYRRIGISSHGGAIRRLLHHLRPELREPVFVGNCVTYRLTFVRGRWHADIEPVFAHALSAGSEAPYR
jgi:broad specificity phosphatase PhoE